MYIGTKKRGLYIVPKREFELACREYMDFVGEANCNYTKWIRLSSEFVDAIDRLRLFGYEKWESRLAECKKYLVNDYDGICFAIPKIIVEGNRRRHGSK